MDPHTGLTLITYLCWGLVGFVVLVMVHLHRLVRHQSRDLRTPAATWQSLARACGRVEPLFWVWFIAMVFTIDDFMWVTEFGLRVILPVGLVFAVLWAGFSSLARAAERSSA